MKVLAIDPGYERLGVAVIEKKDGKESLIFSETIKISAKKDFIQRLYEIGSGVEEIIEKYNPEFFAIEKLFIIM